MNGNIKTLLFEDSDDDVQLIKKCLEKSGKYRYEFKPVTSKIEFIEVLTTYVPDVIFLREPSFQNYIS